MNPEHPSISKIPLAVPTLDNVADAFVVGLRRNFAHASVSVVECPDLSVAPFGLASEGICGSARIAEVGGVSHLIPSPKLDRIYNLGDVRRWTGMSQKTTSVFGAAAANSKFIGVNGELMPNVKMGSTLKNLSTYSIVQNDGTCLLEDYGSLDFALLGNLFLSEGSRGSVLEVKASQRTGNENFISCLRKSLTEIVTSDDTIIGIGGVFNIESGRANCHVMPNFSESPLLSDQEVEDWLRFYNFRSPFTVSSVFLSKEVPGQSTRIEHSHGWNHLNEGGHYHEDVTPEEVSYLGYFNVAESYYRIDKP